jgi:putative hydroxymethylpyrimidine transport system substrate-binding protein
MKNNIIVAAIALSTSLLSMTAKSETKTLTLMLDWFVNPNHGPVIIAKERGYFKAQGLNVDIQEPADPSMPPKLVAASKVDLGISYQPTLTINVAAGLPLIRSATLIAAPLNTLMVLDNNKINDLSDLKGKKIGIAMAGNEEASIGTMLQTVGLTYKDVKIINVGWALSSSLASGRVDAIWGGLRNFEANQLALEGFKAKSFFPEDYGVPLYDELIFVANAHTYDKAAIIGFNKAIEQAALYISHHPQKAWEEFKAYAPDTLNNELNKRAWNDTFMHFSAHPGDADLQRYDEYAKFMYAQKVITTLPKAQDYVPSFK